MWFHENIFAIGVPFWIVLFILGLLIGRDLVGS